MLICCEKTNVMSYRKCCAETNDSKHTKQGHGELSFYYCGIWRQNKNYRKVVKVVQDSYGLLIVLRVPHVVLQRSEPSQVKQKTAFMKTETWWFDIQTSSKRIWKQWRWWNHFFIFFCSFISFCWEPLHRLKCSEVDIWSPAARGRVHNDVISLNRLFMCRSQKCSLFQRCDWFWMKPGMTKGDVKTAPTHTTWDQPLCFWLVLGDVWMLQQSSEVFTLTQSCSVISPRITFRQTDLTDEVGLDFWFASDRFISHSAAKVNGRSPVWCDFLLKRCGPQDDRAVIASLRLFSPCSSSCPVPPGCRRIRLTWWAAAGWRFLLMAWAESSLWRQTEQHRTMLGYTSEKMDFNLFKKLSNPLFKRIFEVTFVDSVLTSMNIPATNIQQIWFSNQLQEIKIKTPFSTFLFVSSRHDKLVPSQIKKGNSGTIFSLESSISFFCIN